MNRGAKKSLALKRGIQAYFSAEGGSCGSSFKSRKIRNYRNNRVEGERKTLFNQERKTFILEVQNFTKRLLDVLLDTCIHIPLHFFNNIGKMQKEKMCYTFCII